MREINKEEDERIRQNKPADLLQTRMPEYLLVPYAPAGLKSHDDDDDVSAGNTVLHHFIPHSATLTLGKGDKVIRKQSQLG